MQQCLQFARKKLKCATKYPLLQISKGINMICSGKPATYYKTLTNAQIDSHLKKGRMILFEEGNPIHTVVLLRDSKTGKYGAFQMEQKTQQPHQKKMLANVQMRSTEASL